MNFQLKYPTTTKAINCIGFIVTLVIGSILNVIKTLAIALNRIIGRTSIIYRNHVVTFAHVSHLFIKRALVISTKKITNYKDQYIKNAYNRFDCFVVSHKLNFNSRSTIISLFFPSSPSTILFRIIAIIVYSFNSRIFFSKLLDMFQIGFIHVVFELLEGKPFISNASSAISRITFRIGILTSFFHATPSLIKSFLGKTMSPSSYILNFIKSTTTGSSMPVHYIGFGYGLNITAIAETYINGFTTFRMRISQYQKTAMFLTRNINKSIAMIHNRIRQTFVALSGFCYLLRTGGYTPILPAY